MVMRRKSAAVRSRSRSGAIAPLTAALMVPLLAMAAFVVDLGYLRLVQQQLHNAADSAALAGASQLLLRSKLQGHASTNTEMDTLRQEAQRFANKNICGGTAITLGISDVVVGYLANPSDQSSVLITDTPVYNSVQVTAQRTAQSNGSVALFLAPLLGRTSMDLKASATASYESVKGFSFAATNNQDMSCKLLPFALLVSTWNAATAGTGPDDWTYDHLTKAVRSGSDGIHEATLFPSKNLTAGNFGTVDIGKSNNSTADVVRQILYGPNKSDFDALGGRIALGADGTTTLEGDTGLSAGFKSALESIIGQPRIIPLYSTVAGVGNNAKFTIVGFAGIVITKVDLTGPSKYITVQPEFVIDPTAIGGGGPDSNNHFVYRPLALTH